MVYSLYYDAVKCETHAVATSRGLNEVHSSWTLVGTIQPSPGKTLKQFLEVLGVDSVMEIK